MPFEQKHMLLFDQSKLHTEKKSFFKYLITKKKRLNVFSKLLFLAILAHHSFLNTVKLNVVFTGG